MHDRIMCIISSCNLEFDVRKLSILHLCFISSTNRKEHSMFGISYDTWKEICDMYFSQHVSINKAYLQWFPFSKLPDKDKDEISGEDFFKRYIWNRDSKEYGRDGR